MKEPVDHILRPQLPWRSTETAITECGYDASAVKTLTRPEYLQRLRDMGQQRAALFTCMTCADTARRWGTWDDDPGRALDREITWECGGSYWRNSDDHGYRLRDELLAIAALIEAHRAEFNELVAANIQRRDWISEEGGTAKAASCAAATGLVMGRPFRLEAPGPKAPRPRLKLTPLELPESTLQERVMEVLDALIQPPTFVFSAAIGATKLSPQQAAALSRAGVKRGLPDVLIIAPPDGRLLGIELKIKGGVLSKTKIVRTRRGSPRMLIGQVERFAELEAAGMPPIAVCRDVDSVLAQLAAWGVPLRGRVS